MKKSQVELLNRKNTYNYIVMDELNRMLDTDEQKVGKLEDKTNFLKYILGRKID